MDDISDTSVFKGSLSPLAVPMTQSGVPMFTIQPSGKEVIMEDEGREAE